MGCGVHFRVITKFAATQLASITDRMGVSCGKVQMLLHPLGNVQLFGNSHNFTVLYGKMVQFSSKCAFYESIKKEKKRLRDCLININFLNITILKLLLLFLMTEKNCKKI